MFRCRIDYLSNQVASKHKTNTSMGNRFAFGHLVNSDQNIYDRIAPHASIVKIPTLLEDYMREFQSIHQAAPHSISARRILYRRWLARTKKDAGDGIPQRKRTCFRFLGWVFSNLLIKNICIVSDRTWLPYIESEYGDVFSEKFGTNLAGCPVARRGKIKRRTA